MALRRNSALELFPETAAPPGTALQQLQPRKEATNRLNPRAFKDNALPWGFGFITWTPAQSQGQTHPVEFSIFSHHPTLQERQRAAPTQPKGQALSSPLTPQEQERTNTTMVPVWCGTGHSSPWFGFSINAAFPLGELQLLPVPPFQHKGNHR